MEGRCSPLRVEFNPWTLDHHLEEALLLRGAFIASMGMIETNLTELAIRASKHAAYTGIRATFPTRRPARIDYLDTVCRHKGPLSQCASLILGILSRFRANLDDRDLFAHGRMQVLSGAQDTTIVRLGDFYAEGGTIVYRESHMITLPELRRKTERVARLSRTASDLYLRLGDALPAL